MRLANYFISQRIPVNQVIELIEKRKRYKKRQLEVMVHYALSNKCKRLLLLEYFNEKIEDREGMCCSNCGNNLSLPYDRVEPNVSVIDKKEGWEIIFNKLFNFSSHPEK